MSLQVCSGFQWLADIRTQTDNVTRSTSPLADTVDASLASEDDGHDDANELFASKTGLTPAKCIAYTERYDTNQAIARIMRIYNMDRADYYEQAVKENDIHRARLKYKQEYTDGLLAVVADDDDDDFGEEGDFTPDYTGELA